MTNFRWIFLAFFFVQSLQLNAQDVYQFRNYTINDGLSQSSVSGILQDENHSLWIGTQDGLNRFDGKRFEIYNSDVTQGIESEYIRCSIKTSDGKLWFGTANGLTVYDPATEIFKTFSLSSAASFQIEKMAVDHQNVFWMASSSNGLISFDTKNGKFKTHSDLVPSKKILNINVNDQNRLIISTEDKGLFVTDSEKKNARPIQFKWKKGKPATIELIKVISGRTFIGTSYGLYELDFQRFEATSAFSAIDVKYGLISISDIHVLKDNTWLIGTSNQGLITMLPDGTIFNSKQDFFQKNALLFNEINSLFEDASGTIWIATERGLSSFNPNHHGFLGVGPSGNLELGIPTQTVWSFGEDKAAKLVFVGTDKGISCYNKEKRIFDQFYFSAELLKELGVTETVVLCMEIISAKEILVGTANGFLRLEIYGPKSYRFSKIKYFKSPEEEQRHNRIYKILKYDDESYFLATKSGAVLYNSKKNKSQLFEHNAATPKETIAMGVCRLVFKDNKNRIYFATSSGGLNFLDEKSFKIRPYPYNSLITAKTNDYISCAYQASDSEFWFGTFGSGLLHWNEKSKQISAFTKKEGLPNNVIYGILPDGLTDLWMSTNKGLCKFNKVNSSTVVYTEEDGLMSNEFNLGAYMKSSTGEFYFGGIYGYNFFNPKSLSTTSDALSVVLTHFKFDQNWLKPGDPNSPISKPISQVSEIFLSYRQRSFTLQFQPTDISNPDQVNYKYLLEGSDEGEIAIGNYNELRFTSLSPGHYKLLIYARFGDGKWGTPTVISIHIGQPFWFQWWFILLVLAILAILVRLIIRNRTEHVRIDQVRLEMKVQKRTEEIRAQNHKIEKQRQLLEEEKNKVVEQGRLLQIEKDKTEKLLKNIIPESTAEELKNKGRASARAYKTVSVIFTDFVGFTKIAERMTPSELVSRLDVYFRKFDEIIVKNNLEKIKTIGDAYMCAGGVPVRNNTNPIDACLAALQIQDYMTRLKFDALANDSEFWELRLGINTGEVTAGVIGSERLAYDIWGSTVNKAQRMEMLGEKGKVTVSDATFNHIEPYFECTFKGKALTKSNEKVDMYTVDRIKTELSVNGEGVYPNERFHQIVNLHHFSSINYYKAERHIMKVLDKKLSKSLHYHSIAHTKDVVKAVERIALSEGVTDEGLFLLKSAATYHDAGFVEQYDKNEPVGARMADEILPKYGYTEQHINTIKELIYVTQIPHQPKNKLEEIMCDADLDYLGRDDFHEIADKLRRELKEHGKIDSDRKWDEMQVSFLGMHKYFTETSINSRLAKKMLNMEEVKHRLLKNEYED
ncbi:MAG: adenylate/guanylate cyclase domain-containing protein [Bacteroidota bacterium]